MYIIVGGDLVPTESNVHWFNDGNTERLFGKPLCDMIINADFSVFNLETPITDTLKPIKKSGPCLHAPVSSLNAIKSLHVRMMSLANNHILDQGVLGLQSTIESLYEMGIEYVGVINNLCDEGTYKIVKLGSVSVGIYSCAEHEFSVATDNSSGANPYDALRASVSIGMLRKQCDFTIVLYHGGKEYYRFPTPQLQKRCRLLADFGANLVICQHSHCIGCKEQYNDSTIVYGQGNFCFDRVESGKEEYWSTGLLIRLNITEKKAIEIDYIPIVKERETVRLANENESSGILAEHLLDERYIEAMFNDCVERFKIDYIVGITSKESIFFRMANKMLRNKLRVFKFKRQFPERKLLTIQNFIECETHREILIQLLRNQSGERNE